MREELIQLADTYLKAGEAIHDAIRESIRKAGGFLNCSNKGGYMYHLQYYLDEKNNRHYEEYDPRD